MSLHEYVDPGIYIAENGDIWRKTPRGPWTVNGQEWRPFPKSLSKLSVIDGPAISFEADVDSFGARVLKRRKSLGVSRKDLGEQIGVSPEYIRLLETRQRNPPSDKIKAALEAALNIERDD